MDSNLNNRLVRHRKKRGLFLDFHYGFKTCRLVVDLLTFVSDRLSRAFDMLGIFGALALDMSKVFTGFGMLVSFTNSILRNFRLVIWLYFVFSP